MATTISSIGLLDPQQLTAITRLSQIGKAIAENNKRISTLRRINSASDDPAGLVSMTRLEGELSALSASSTGLTRANSLIDTAADAAGKIVDQLTEARTLALAVAGGTLSSSEIAGKQIEFDSILRTIDNLSQSEFNGRRLLDGSSSFSAHGVDASKIKDLQILDKQTADDVAVSVQVTAAATKASNSYTGGTLAGAANVTISGPQGTATVSLGAGATTDDIANAFNAASYLTGVTATKINASQVNFSTVAYGSAAEISFETTSGTFNLTTSGTVAGTDATATINGQTVTGDGATFTVNTEQTALRIAVDPSLGTTSTSFTVSGEGLQFVLGPNVSSAARIGMPELNTASLNSVFGTLHSTASGGANSLISGNAANAIRIIDDALLTATVAESRLGSFSKYTLGSAKTIVDKTTENVSAALNAVAGVNVALETSLLANNQLLQQATAQSLLMFNEQRQNLLSLLTNFAAKT